MKNFFSLVLLVISFNNLSAQSVVLPDTYAGNVFKEFISAYNSGDEISLRQFAEKYYTKDIEDKIDYWLEKFYWYGPVTMFDISINDPYDLEVWLKGNVTNEYFAVEIIINEETGKIKGTGFLSGEQPDNAPDISVSLTELPATLQNYIDSLCTDDFFSGSVLVAKDGFPVFQTSCGFADKQNWVKNTLNTRFNLASVTKTLTGIAIAILVEQGRISYEDPISKFIPEYPADISEKVTIHNLLTHTSGIELDHTNDFNNAKRKSLDLEALLKTHIEYLNTLENRDSFKTLTKFDYSNEGYDLASLIVERVSDMSFLQFLEENIFDPAGMYQTGVRKDSFAVGYTNYIDLNMTFKRGERVPNSIFLHPLFGSAGLYSTVGDLNRLISALNTKKLLSNTIMQYLFSPQLIISENEKMFIGTSYGFEIIKKNGITSIGHNGGDRGVSTELRYYPEYGYTVVVLSNYRHSAINVSNYIYNLLF